MKLKEINRTAIQSWSPAQQHPVYLAAGTSAQQLDASFSTNASLEIFELDLAEPSLDMKSCGTYSSSHRYHKLVWGPHGMEGSHPSGVLIAGGENGDVILYDPAKIVAGDSDVIITQSNKHTGPVRALDVNSFQTNLVASGGNESEIYIWDLNNFGSPMTPGPKTQPLEDISCVAWNRQVQHILASASPSGRASVWDLRKNDLIIKVSDHSNRMHCSGLAWNPEVATQLVLASEDDRMPVIQMWDLRFATSPFKILENHTRGVLAIAWSLADPELLLSCGKDNRILCWNPNTAEVLYELPTSTQWCFDIQWCPRNPAVLSAAAFDGHIGIYSIMGGSSQAHTQRQADQITSSFGNMDPFGTGQTLPPLQMPQTPAAPVTITPLKKPPKWIRRPVGASFAFGGKLVSLENLKLNPQQPQQTTAHLVHVSQVVTETAFLKRSGQLQMTLSSGNFVDFCEAKIAAAQNEFERTIWSFLKVNFEDDARGKYLELLGYKKEELALKIAAALEEKPVQPEKPVPDFDPASSLGLQLLPDFDPTPSLNLQPVAELDPAPPISLPPLVDSGLNLSADLPPEAAFDLIAAANLQPAVEPEETPAPEAEVPAGLLEPEVDPEGETPEASDGEVQTEPSAVEPLHVEEEIPLEEEVTAPVEAAPVEAAPVEAESSPAEETVEEITGPGSVEAGINLRVSQDVDGLITQALLTGDFEGAVELCLHDNRMADSIILAIAGGAELLEKTQKKYFTKTHSKITKLISAVVTKDWRDVLQTCDLQSWKEALAAVMTYAQPDEFSSLCGMMGSRLEAAEEDQLQAQACLCYICAGNLEKLVSCWTKAQDGQCPLSLQDLVEKVVVLRQAVERSQGSGSSVVGALLAEKMSQYSSLLASQGSLDTALAYLPDNTNQAAVQQLRERLSRALGQQATAPPAPAPAPAPAQPPAPQQTEAHPRQTYNPGQPQVPQPAPAPVPSAGPTQSQYYQPVEAGQPRFGMQAPGTAAPPQASAAPPSYMYSQQYQPYHQVNQFQPGAGAPTIYQPLQYSAAPLPPASSCCPPAPAPGFRAQYMQPGPPPPGPPPPRYPGPPAGQPPSPHPLSPTASSAFSPLSSSSGASFQHGGPGSPSSYMPPPPPTGSSGTLPEPAPDQIPASQRTGLHWLRPAADRLSS